MAGSLPAGAYQAGGTAPAVHRWHPVSRDLDVLIDRPFDTGRVRAASERPGDLTVISSRMNSR